MLRIPGGNFLFEVSGIEIEGDNQIGVDVQYPWENAARRAHSSKVQIKSFYMDRYPVTKAAFKAFLDAAKYRPSDDHNFLKDWKNGSFPDGWANKPVTWVSLEDARAYARWAGKRLPHDGSGNTRPRVMMDAFIRGESSGTQPPCPFRIRDALFAVRTMFPLIRAARVRLALKTSRAMSGSGLTNSQTTTRGRQFCVAGATTSRRVLVGISLRPTNSTNMESCC
jgi:hypothetical protein